MDKREAILSAALRLIAQNGFHGTPVSEIAKLADVGAGTVYRYFKDKEELLNQLYLDVKSRMHMKIGEGLLVDMPFEQLFKLVWLNMLDYYIAHPQEFSFYEQYYYSPFLTEETRASAGVIFSDHAQAFEKAVRDGVVQNLPGEMVSSILFGTTSSLARKHLSGLLEMTPELKQQAAHAAWCSIRK